MAINIGKFPPVVTQLHQLEELNFQRNALSDEFMFAFKESINKWNIDKYAQEAFHLSCLS